MHFFLKKNLLPISKSKSKVSTPKNLPMISFTGNRQRAGATPYFELKELKARSFFYFQNLTPNLKVQLIKCAISSKKKF